jgi:ribosomal protein L24E
VFPGHGRRFVTRTGQLVILSSSKVTSLYHQRKKPAKLYWTQASRRMHKKLNQEAAIKKRARRVVKLQRGFVGAENLDEVRRAAPVGRGGGDGGQRVARGPFAGAAAVLLAPEVA